MIAGLALLMLVFADPLATILGTSGAGSRNH
jgi:hypothetical protein